MSDVDVEGSICSEEWKRGLCLGFFLTLAVIVAGLLALFFLQIQGLPPVSAGRLGSGGLGLPEGAATGGLY